MRKKNRNDIIITEEDTKNQMYLKDFKYKDMFKLLCYLVPEVDKERIIIEDSGDGLIDKKGILYLLVLDGKILKVGSSTVSFKERVSSYNCGKKAFRNNGTCSTTNYFVLQSLLNINKKVEVYYFFPEEIEMDVFGEKEMISLPAKRFEKSILTELKEKHKLPVLCTQK